MANFAYIGLLLATNNVILAVTKAQLDKKYPNTASLIKAHAAFSQSMHQLGWLIIATLILSALAYLPVNRRLESNWTNFDLVNVLRAVRNWSRKNKRYLWGILGATILSYSSFLFVSPNFKITLNMGPTYSTWHYIFLARPMMIWLNALIIIALWGIIFGLTNRYWVSTLGVAIGMLVLFVTENIKVGISLIVYMERKYSQPGIKWLTRVVLVAVSCLFFSSSLFLNHNKGKIHTVSLALGNGQFINLVSMQNHFPYDKEYYDGTKKYRATGSAVTDETTADMIADFATGLSYTDKAVANFIKQIDKLNRPVTIVFYGDHLPGIYSGNNMKKDGVVLHETDYFIYSNKYARKHGAKTKLAKAIGLVAPNDFPAMVAEQTNSKVNGYLALLTKVKDELPAMSTNPKMNATNNYNTMVSFVTKQGKILKPEQLTKKQQELYHDYQLVQYDMTAGKQYLLKNKDFSK